MNWEGPKNNYYLNQKLGICVYLQKYPYGEKTKIANLNGYKAIEVFDKLDKNKLFDYLEFRLNQQKDIINPVDINKNYFGELEKYLIETFNIKFSRNIKKLSYFFDFYGEIDNVKIGITYRQNSELIYDEKNRLLIIYFTYFEKGEDYIKIKNEFEKFKQILIE